MLQRDIDLNIVTGGGKVQNLSGRDRGESVREQFGLDDWDAENTQVRVLFPNYLVSISSSFFLGMFSKSYVTLGGKEEFLKKYDFSGADSNMMNHINDGLKRCRAVFH